MATSPNWFITDKAITDPKQDAFGHDQVADQLIEMINSITPPATIGLLGGFGAGKSSIANLLSNKLRNHADFQVVTLSIEKHSETARQRALVYSFAESLEEDAKVDKAKVRTLLQRVEGNETVTAPQLTSIPLLSFIKENSSALWKSLGIGAIVAFALYLLGVVASWIVEHLLNIELNPWTAPFSTAYLGIPLVLSGFTILASLGAAWGKEALTPTKSSRMRARAEAADELERVFADLVRLVRKRLVIIVDDVDRLSPREVLEALASIRSFQAVPRDKSPIFILSCDEATVRTALEDANPGLSRVHGSEEAAATAYLDKLFVVRQPVPPIIREDMQQFAVRLLTSSGSNHAGKEALASQLSPVLEVLIHDGVQDPRHVIRLINAFFADYRLAMTREVAGGRLGPGAVTKNPLTLARLTVLRVDFPTYYAAVREEFELLQALDLHVLGNELDESQRRILEQSPARDTSDNQALEPLYSLPSQFVDFLRRTARYVERDVPLAPFFFLGESSAGRILGSQRAAEIRRALENNDEAYLRERMTDEATVASAAVSHVQASLQAARPGLPLTNAVSTAAAVLPDVPAEVRSILADQISVLVLREPDSVPQPEYLVNVIESAGEAHRPTLIQKLTTFEGRPEDDAERARCILILARSRPGDSVLRGALEEYFTKLPETSTWISVSPWIDEVGSMTPSEQGLVLGPWFFAAIIQSTIGAPEESIAIDEGQAAARLLESAPDEVRSSRQVSDAILACCAAEGKEPRWFALLIMGAVRPLPENMPKLLKAQNDVILGSETFLYDETISLAMTNFANWAQQPELLDSVNVAEAKRTVDHLVVGLNVEKEEVACEAAKGARLAAGLWPSQCDGLAETLIEKMVQHRSVDDVLGLALRDAALAILSNVSDDHASRIGHALLDPLATSNDDSADDSRFSLDALGLLVGTDAGRSVAADHIPSWRARFNTTVAVSSELRPPANALEVVSASSALPEDQEAPLWTRLQQLPQYGQVMIAVAFEVASQIHWRPGRRNEVSTFLASHWAASSEESRRWVLSHVSRWMPRQNELSNELSGYFADLLLADFEESARNGYLNALWDGFAPEHRAQITSRLHGSAVVQAKLGEITEEEIYLALRDAGDQVEGLVDSLSRSANPAVSSAVRRHVEASIFDSTHGWADDSVRLSLALIAPQEALTLADRALEGLSDGSGVAARAASALGWLRERHHAELAHLDGRLATSITELLPDADPDLAGRLGHASRNIDKSEFEPTLRSMRKRTAEHSTREAAAAFATGRSGG